MHRALDVTVKKVTSYFSRYLSKKVTRSRYSFWQEKVTSYRYFVTFLTIFTKWVSVDIEYTQYTNIRIFTEPLGLHNAYLLVFFWRKSGEVLFFTKMYVFFEEKTWKVTKFSVQNLSLQLPLPLLFFQK